MRSSRASRAVVTRPAHAPRSLTKCLTHDVAAARRFDEKVTRSHTPSSRFCLPAPTRLSASRPHSKKISFCPDSRSYGSIPALFPRGTSVFAPGLPRKSSHQDSPSRRRGRFSPATLYVHGLGHAHPDNQRSPTASSSRSTSAPTTPGSSSASASAPGARSSLSSTSAPPATTMCGRHSRRPLEQRRAAARAARLAVERAGISLADIGMVIAAARRRHRAPAEACNVAAELGLECPPST